MTFDFDTMTVRRVAREVSRGRISPVEMTKAVLARIEALNPGINAILTVTADAALRAAGRLETRLRRGGTAGPLAGVPITIKDLMVTEDAPTTLGSRVIPEGLPAGPDAPAVARLRRAGAIVIGKANLHEVALGVTSENEHFGPVRNPRDRRRVAGGSSGGSAAAVATGLGLISVGTDTRGSIRIPAACCGVVGFKPSYGLVPTDGVFPLAASLDHVGPLARSVDDAAIAFGVMAGGRRRSRVEAAMRRPPRRFTIGVVESFYRDADPAVAATVFQAIRTLERAGARVVDVTIPELEPALEASRVIVLAEAISYHDELLRRNRRGYGPAVRARLVGGYRLSALERVRAEEVRVALMAAYAAVFRRVDCLVTPALPTAPPRIGTRTIKVAGRRLSPAEAFCGLHAPQNLTGVPALVLPCGSVDGLPVGLQLIGGTDRDAHILAIGRRCEAVGAAVYPGPE